MYNSLEASMKSIQKMRIGRMREREKQMNETFSELLDRQSAVIMDKRSDCFVNEQKKNKSF